LRIGKKLLVTIRLIPACVPFGSDPPFRAANGDAD
jgi:hypothetical protein